MCLEHVWHQFSFNCGKKMLMQRNNGLFMENDVARLIDGTLPAGKWGDEAEWK